METKKTPEGPSSSNVELCQEVLWGAKGTADATQ